MIQFQEHAPVNPVGMGHCNNDYIKRVSNNKAIKHSFCFVDAMNLVRMELTAKTARPVAGVRMAVHAAPLMANVSVLADGR